MMGGHLWLCALEDDDPFLGVTGYMLLRHTGGGPPNVPGMGMRFGPFSQCSGEPESGGSSAGQPGAPWHGQTKALLYRGYKEWVMPLR